MFEKKNEQKLNRKKERDGKNNNVREFLRTVKYLQNNR